MKTRTKRIISTLAICGALLLEAGATAIGSLGKALNNIAKVDAADTETITYTLSSVKWAASPASWTSVADMTYTTGSKYGLDKNGTAGAISPISYTNAEKFVFSGSKSGSGAGTCELFWSTSNSAGGTWTSLGSKTFAASVTWTLSTKISGYFKFQMTRTNGNIYAASLAVTHEKAPTETMDDFAVSLTDASKTRYAGDSVSGTDVTITPHYPSGNGNPVTNGEGVTITGNPLVEGANSLSVSYTDGTTSLGPKTLSVNNVRPASEKPLFVSYSVKSATEVELADSTVAPEGTSATFKNTYTNNKEQITKDNTTRLTLSGWADYCITGVTLSMHSNASAGAGKMSLTAGETTLAEISSATNFNNWYDSSGYSTSYSDIHVNFIKDDYVIQSGEDIVLLITGTTSSLYLNKYTFYYEENSLPKLSTPSNLKYENGIISWSNVTGNCGYKVLINNDTDIPLNPDITSLERVLSVTDTVSVIALGDGITTRNSDAAKTTYIFYGSDVKPLTVSEADKLIAYDCGTEKGKYTNSPIVVYGKLEYKATKASKYDNYNNITLVDDNDSTELIAKQCTRWDGKFDEIDAGTYVKISSYGEYYDGRCLYPNGSTADLITEITGKEITGIEVTTQPTNKEYFNGESFNPAGMVVKAIYNIGDPVVLTSDDYTIDPSVMTPSTTSVTVKYNDNTELTDEIEGIDVKTYSDFVISGNTKTSFRAGDLFDFDGTVNKVYIHSQTTKEDTLIPVSGYTFSYEDGTPIVKGSDKVSYGMDQKIVISYDDGGDDPLTVDYTIDVDYAFVNNASFTKISDLGPKGTIDLDNYFNILPAEANQEANYEVVAEDTTTSEYTLSGGTLTINDTVTTGGKIVIKGTTVGKTSGGESIFDTVEINVKKEEVPVLTGITPSITGTIKATQYVGHDFDPTGFTFTLVYTPEKEGPAETIDGSLITWDKLVADESVTGSYTNAKGEKADVDMGNLVKVEEDINVGIAFDKDVKMTKTSYVEGESWSRAGITAHFIKASGDAGDSVTLEDSNFSFNPSVPAVGVTSVTVTIDYGTFDSINKDFEVSVKANEVESMVVTWPSVDTYTIGDPIDMTDFSVTGTYSDGTVTDITSLVTTNLDSLDIYTPGDKVMTVDCGNAPQQTKTFHYQKAVIADGGWNLVTDASTLKAGDVLVIACPSKETVAGDISNNVMTYLTDSTFNESKNQITTLSSNAVQLTLGGSEGNWTFANSGKQLLGATAVKKLAWGSGTTTWSISISDGNATIQNGTSTYGRFLYNATANQERFTSYTSATSSSMLLPSIFRYTKGTSKEVIKFDVEGPTSAFIGQTLTVDDLTNKSVLFNDGTTDISNAVFKINGADSITVDENTPIVVSCKAKNGTKDALTKTLTIERVNPSVTLTKDGSATSDFTISETSATYGSDFEATISSVSGATKVTGISVKMNGVTLVDNDDYTFENGVLWILEVTGNIEVDITSAETQKYTVTLTEGKPGSVTLTNKDPVEHGASYSATISLNPGYQLNAHKITVKMGGTDITSTAYTEATGAIYIESVTGNIEVIADSSHVLYTINYSGFGEGTKHAATDPVLYTISDKVVITPELEEHYKDLAVIVYIGGADKTSEVYKDGVITLQNCMGDVTFNISATRITYDVSFDYDDTKITPSSTENKAAEGLPYSNGFGFDEFKYEIDRDLTEITMENKGGALIDLSDKGVLTISEVTGDISIKIVLKNKMYPVVTDDSVGGYTINPGQIDALGNATINFTLKDHYNFDGVTTISATVAGSEKSYTLEGNPTDGYKITIPQEDIIDSIVLTTDANHDNCTLSATTIGVNGAIIENPKTYNTAIDYTFVIKEGFDASTLNVNLTCYGETFTDFELINNEGIYHIKFTIKGDTDIHIDAKAKVTSNFTPENMISNSNVDPTAIAGGFYTGTLTFIEGYDPDKTTVKIEMRDDLGEFQDITNSAYTVATGVIYIDDVTGEIKITASTQLKVFDVTFDGDTSNYTPSIVPTDITYGNPCGTVIAPNTGYKLTSVIYVMGDADPVTVTIREDGKAEIDIEKVIGDIVITATTEALPMDVVIVSGDVTADKTTVAYDEENVLIKVTADTGYHLTSLKFTNNDGEAIIVDIGEDKSYAYLSVDKVKGNIKIYAETEINEYTLAITGNNLLDDSYATVVAVIDGKPVSLSSGSVTVKHFQEGVQIIITLRDGKRLVLPVEGSYDNPVYSMNGSTDGLTWSSQYNTLTIDTVTGDISFRCDIEKIPVDAAYTFDVTVIENKVGPSVIYQGEEVTYEFKIKDALVKTYQFDKENSYVKTYVDGVLTDIKDQTYVWNYDESTGILYVVVSNPNTLVDIKIAHEYIEYTITSSESELYYIEVPEEIHFGDEDVEVNIVPDDHCSITEVKVYLDGALIESGYTYSNNVVTIASIEGDYLIDATVVHDDVTVVLDPALSTDISFSINDPQEKYPYGTKIIGTFTPAPNFELPSEIEVFVYDSDTALNPTDYVYNSSSGYFEITAKGDIRIVAHGSQGKVNIYYTVDEHSSLSPAFDSGILVDKGLALSLTVIVEEGYVVDYVTVVMKQGTDPIEKAFNPYENTIYLNSVTDNVYITVVTKVAVQTITYDTVNATVKAGDQNPPATINYGGELVLNVSAVNGYTLDGATVKVVIDGTRDITATAYSNGVITIDKVDGDVAITVIAKPIPQVIDYPSAYVDFTNKPESVNYNDPFKTTFNIQSGYELDDTDGIVITMAGVDITDSVLEGQTISIEHVTGEVKIVFNMHAITYPVDTSSVDEKITIVGNVEEVTHGESYVVKLVADDHYHITSVTVEMAGVDITDLVFVDGVININAVTGDITITAEVEADVYAIDNSGLTNVTNNNSATSVNYDDSYEATLSPADGYFDVKFTVTMGGVVVDCTGNTISIEHVTGDIVIKASATKVVAVDIIATLDDAFKVVDFDSEFPIDSVTVVLLNNDGSTAPYLGEISFDGYNKAEYGVQTVTIIAGTFSDTVEIEVLKSLVVDQVTDVSTYEASYDFGYDLTIADIIVFYDTTDGLSHSDAPDSIVDGTYDITKSGEQHVKVMFDGSQYEVVVHINASTEVESISAVVVSGKDELEYGDPFTVNDVVVTAKYTDGNTETVDAELVVFKGTPGANVVVVLAKGKTCTVSVTVKTSTVIDSISAGAKEESYAYGTTLTVDDFTVTATYTDGHTGTVTATSVDAITLVPGFNVVTIRVNDKSCQVVVKVNDSTVVDSIKAVIKDGKDVVAYDGAFTKDDVVVYATYTDHQTKVVTDFEMTGFDGKHIGVNTVTISLGGKTCTVKVTVLESTIVDHIVATATKDNLTYGDTFTKEDVKVTQVYTDGHEVKDLTPDSITGFTGVPGDNKVTVSLGDKTVDIHVTVKQSEVIQSIEASVNEGRDVLEYKEPFTVDDVTVVATYTDGHTAVVAADSVDFAGTVGENTVVVHVGELTDNVTVTVKESTVIIGIEATTEKSNVEYGGTFTKDDVKASYVYEDGHKVAATVDSIEGFNATQLGKQTITVHVGEYTTTLEITVSGRVVLSIEAIGYNDSVDQGREYTFGGKVIAHYNDGTSEEVTGYTVDKVDTSGHGPQTVKVTYEGVSTSFTISVIQTKGDLEPYQSVAIISGAVIGVSAIAVGIFFLLKKFKI